MTFSKDRLIEGRKLRFVVVGLIGATIEIILFSVLVRAGLGVSFSNFLAFHCAFLICFFLHYYFTHQKRYNGMHVIVGGLLKYAGLMYVQLLVGTVLLWLLIEKYGWVAEFAKIAQIGVVTPVSYLVQKYFIFSENKK